MKRFLFKFSLITMLVITAIFSIDYLGGQFSVNGDDDKAELLKGNSDTGAVLAANKEEKQINNIDLSWLEKGSDGQLNNIEFPLGTDKEQILLSRGEAIDTGYYEGGEYFRYEDVTFFINPETNRLVAIALSTEKYDLDGKKLEETLGSPNVSERNEMEGLWMYEYDLGKYSLMFEAKEEEGEILFVWLREKI
ncbi:hypothetical protein [Alkalihalobacterium elongatum]|uniref:hypothetical protein n=1 Tax=Alkalihalobacterium elongatum TaxID=2675466 RepID=UPI001C1F8F25|nr:hypothetical protein [Alkalihalobacterium elongatum]